jgi:hypothetical protein
MYTLGLKEAKEAIDAKAPGSMPCKLQAIKVLRSIFFAEQGDPVIIESVAQNICDLAMSVSGWCSQHVDNRTLIEQRAAELRNAYVDSPYESIRGTVAMLEEVERVGITNAADLEDLQRSVRKLELIQTIKDELNK